MGPTFRSEKQVGGLGPLRVAMFILELKNTLKKKNIL